MRRQDSLRQALKQVIREGSCAEELDFQRLRAAGILTGDSRESAQLRCGLYRQYLAKHL
jgi:hypothetical protein